MFCGECGQKLDEYAINCIDCGASVTRIKSKKEWLALLLLSIFLGNLGVDRFYSGRIISGFIKIIGNFFSLGIWQYIDVLLICFGKFKDREGIPIIPSSKKVGIIIFVIYNVFIFIFALLYITLLIMS
jgi:hypothetical protein